MNPLILSGITGGLGLAQSIYGGIKSAKAAREQKKLLNQRQAQNDAWYNKNYYQDYMDRSDSKAAMNRVTSFMDRRTKQADATAAVTGATPEQVMAQKEQANTALAQTVGSIAQNADTYKDQVQGRYDNVNNSILQGQMQQYQMDEQGGANLAASGVGMMGSALNNFPVKDTAPRAIETGQAAIDKLNKAYERDFQLPKVQSF